jgi:hypothetical protein
MFTSADGLGFDVGCSTADLEFIYSFHFPRLANASCLQCLEPVVACGEKDTKELLG